MHGLLFSLDLNFANLEAHRVRIRRAIGLTFFSVRFHRTEHDTLDAIPFSLLEGYGGPQVGPLLSSSQLALC